MSLTELKKRKREEYEMQLYGFHSGAVYTTLKSLLEQRIHTKCKQLCESIDNKYKLDDEKRHLLDKNRRKLTRAYYLGLKAHLPAIEKCIDKLMNIPQYVLLDGDKSQEIQYSAEEFEIMKNNHAALQQRIKRATVWNEALKNEVEISDQFENHDRVSQSLCSVISSGSYYPELNSNIEKLVKKFIQVETCYKDTSCDSDNSNKKRCLTLSPIKININNL